MPIRLLSALLFFLFFPMPYLAAQELTPQPVNPARLELGFDLRMNRFDTETDRIRSGIEPSVSLGLGWTPLSWLSVHGRIEAGLALTLEAPMSYQRNKQTLETWHLGSLGLLAALDVHWPGKLVILTIDVGARCYFAPARAGMFLIDTGLSLGSEPYHAQNTNAVLQSLRFTAGVRFPLMDDFGTIFGHKRTMPVVVFGIILGY